MADAYLRLRMPDLLGRGPGRALLGRTRDGRQLTHPTRGPSVVREPRASLSAATPPTPSGRNAIELGSRGRVVRVSDGAVFGRLDGCRDRRGGREYALPRPERSGGLGQYARSRIHADRSVRLGLF